MFLVYFGSETSGLLDMHSPVELSLSEIEFDFINMTYVLKMPTNRSPPSVQSSAGTH